MISAQEQRRPQDFQPGNPWRYPKGVSGNPGGRPKGLSLSSRLKKRYTDPAEADAVLEALHRAAREGDIQAIRTILSYDSGLPAQQDQGEGKEEGPAPEIHLEDGDGEREGPSPRMEEQE